MLFNLRNFTFAKEEDMVHKHYRPRILEEIKKWNEMNLRLCDWLVLKIQNSYTPIYVNFNLSFAFINFLEFSHLSLPTRKSSIIKTRSQFCNAFSRAIGRILLKMWWFSHQNQRCGLVPNIKLQTIMPENTYQSWCIIYLKISYFRILINLGNFTLFPPDEIRFRDFTVFVGICTMGKTRLSTLA